MRDEVESTTPIPERADLKMNSAQKLHLRVSCQYIDKLLSGIEDILHAAESRSPFPKYKVDINLAQIRTLEDYIRRFRTQLLDTLAWQGIGPAAPEIPATRAIGVNLTFIDITLADLRPSAMRGSGHLPEAVATELAGVVQELGSFTENMMSYVRRELDQSLRDRIGALPPSASGALLRKVEEVVSRQGLVEFRPRLDALLARLEDQTFEIAVFGRVSSGKSSFLNALLQQDLLPVGVNPITAVPTRISFGEQIQACVRYGSGATVEVSLDEFRGLISERSNPGNERAITRAALKAPSDFLANGTVLVDTPGLGSLARRGGAETLAYLPSCDLALLLVDAGSTLTEEDIATARLLRDAGIEALVLLSKCDLLLPEDVQFTVRYMEEQFFDHLQQRLPVFPVSSVPQNRSTLEAIAREELSPLVVQAARLRVESVQAKLAKLLADVVGSLRVRADRQQSSAVELGNAQKADLDVRLRALSSQTAAMGSSLEQGALELRGATENILDILAGDLAQSADESSAELNRRLSEAVETAVQSKARPLIALAQEAVRSAIEATRSIGSELGQADLPDEREFDALFREAPRFDFVPSPVEAPGHAWRLLGSRVLRFRVRNRLTDQLGPALSRALEDYARAFDLWSRSLTRGAQQSLQSYLQTYRSVLQNERAGVSPQGEAEQLEADLAELQADPQVVRAGAQ